MKKLRISLTTILLLSILSLSSLFHPSSTQAQSSNVYDLGVTPQVTYWHVRPGEMITHSINIKNQGINTLEVSPQLVEFISDGVSGIPILDMPHPSEKKPVTKNPFPYIDIINPDVSWNAPFLLNPGQEKNIKLRVEPPADIDEEEHHLTVLFSAKQAIFEEIGNDSIYNSVEDSNSIVSGTVGSNMIVLVSDSDQNKGNLTIADFQIPRIVDSFKPITFSILAENSGLNATPMQGKASIISLTNKKLIEYTFYPDMILASSTRKVRGIDSTIIDEIKETGLEAEEIELLTTDFTYSKPFLLGIYNVEVFLGENQENVTVLALPISPLVFIAIATMIYFGYVFVSKKSYYKKN